MSKRDDRVHTRWLLTIDRTADLLGQLIFWGGLVWLARYGYMTVEALAGKETDASVVLNFLGNLSVSISLAWAIGIGGAAYGWQQRKLRKDVTERLQSRIKELETAIDSKRSTSKLTPRGETNPGDKR